METNYKQLSINERINIKSHFNLPMSYLFKEGLLVIDLENAFGDKFIGGKTAKQKAGETLIDHRKFGIAVEREHYKKIIAKFQRV